MGKKMVLMSDLSCRCGRLHLRTMGKPLIVTECHCNSCRQAAARLADLPDAPRIVASNGGTPTVLYRKDRVLIVEGAEHLGAFRLKPDAKTRRVVATCCNTPIFMDFSGGHWVDLYRPLWPDGDMPAVQIRTMTGDLPDASVLDGHVPSGPLTTARFFAQLLVAWAAMGFRSPRIEVAGEIEA